MGSVCTGAGYFQGIPVVQVAGYRSPNRYHPDYLFPIVYGNSKLPTYGREVVAVMLRYKNSSFRE